MSENESKKPKIYAFCDGGCKWETVHKDDFDKSATWVKQFADGGVYQVATKNNYKIVSPVASNAYSCVVSLLFVKDGVLAEHTFTIAEYDEYRNYFYFEILSLTATATVLTVVYEINGNRYTETVEAETSISTIQNALSISGATAVYAFNPDASIVGVQGEKGDKGDTGATGATIVSTVLQGQDANGGNIYKQTFDNGATAEFTAPKGEAGDKGDTGAQGVSVVGAQVIKV